MSQKGENHFLNGIEGINDFTSPDRAYSLAVEHIPGYMGLSNITEVHSAEDCPPFLTIVPEFVTKLESAYKALELSAKLLSVCKVGIDGVDSELVPIMSSETKYYASRIHNSEGLIDMRRTINQVLRSLDSEVPEFRLPRSSEDFARYIHPHFSDYPTGIVIGTIALVSFGKRKRIKKIEGTFVLGMS